jgi:hypothetical protein
MWAQTIPLNIIHDLESHVQGEGIIQIEVDSKITNLLGTPSHKQGMEENTITKISGYRIQIFMSNNARTARNEAAHKESLIREIFPELATYIDYQAPNWKLLAGDFMSKEEAGLFKQKIQKAFPEFGKELYIVADKIIVVRNY